MKKFTNYSALVVDDHIETLESMQEYLEIEFSKVFSTTNAKDALMILYKENPDIIFTDIKMPEEDGFSLIEKISNEKIDIPVVIISAYDNKENLLKAIKLNVVDYIVKPLNSVKLKETMNLCLDKLHNEVKLGNDYIWKKDKALLYKNNQILKLTDSETKLLDLLVRNLDTPVKSTEIFDYIWADENKEYNNKSLRNIIYKIRKKLKNDNFIENIYGSKYMIRSSR